MINIVQQTIASWNIPIRWNITSASYARRRFSGSPETIESFFIYRSFLSLFHYLADFDGDEVYGIRLYTFIRI